VTEGSVFITGVSSGIGHALADHALGLGYRVYGTSRRRPERLLGHENFRFAPIDLLELDRIGERLAAFLEPSGCRHFDFAFLNAGSFGAKPARGERVTLDAFTDLFKLNLFANKAIIDHFVMHRYSIDNYVVSSSIAAVRQREGMLAYAASKAALNAMISVYALENRESFFALLGLCNVDTHVGRTITDVDASFPDLFALKQRARQSGYVVSPGERARHIFDVMRHRADLDLKSGTFTEIRTLLLARHATRTA
jgi:benzil reductase ((S)-benzoin forming)